MIRNILVPTDGSDHAIKAVAFAADLAKTYGARTILLHIVSDWGSERVPEELRRFSELEHVQMTEHEVRLSTAREILNRAEAVAREHGTKNVESIIEDGRPAKAIVETAKTRGVDLIVMGSRGLGDAQSVLLGSVSHAVSHLAECTCVTVK